MPSNISQTNFWNRLLCGLTTTVSHSQPISNFMSPWSIFPIIVTPAYIACQEWFETNSDFCKVMGLLLQISARLTSSTHLTSSWMFQKIYVKANKLFVQEKRFYKFKVKGGLIGIFTQKKAVFGPFWSAVFLLISTKHFGQIYQNFLFLSKEY